MKNQITYLIGAGASANTLPVVRKISKCITSVIKIISHDDFTLSDKEQIIASSDSYEATRQEIIADLKWMQEKCDAHASVDTFAKKLSLQKNMKELNRLKNILSVFFTLVQLHYPYDKRYDTFFASILNDNVDGFPDNIKIVSWNYDYQFERAYCEYSGNYKLKDAWRQLKVHHNYREYTGSKHSGFEIFKLNGAGQIYDPSEKKFHCYVESLNEPLKKDVFSAVVYEYAHVKYYPPKNESTLHFAWEGDKTIVEDVQNSIRLTDTLIILGYSFPFFNREIDKEILKNLNLSKVYIQAPAPYAEGILERFQAIKGGGFNIGNNAVLYKDYDQFLLPNEL